MLILMYINCLLIYHMKRGNKHEVIIFVWLRNYYIPETTSHHLILGRYIFKPQSYRARRWWKIQSLFHLKNYRPHYPQVLARPLWKIGFSALSKTGTTDSLIMLWFCGSGNPWKSQQDLCYVRYLLFYAIRRTLGHFEKIMLNRNVLSLRIRLD